MRKWSVGVALCALLFSEIVSAQTAGFVPIEHRTQVASAAFPVSKDTPGFMAAHFINVGQGSAALFEFSCGVVLVDTGGQDRAPTDWKKRLVQYLDQVFSRRTDLNRTIDVVYITHPHPDHTLGVAGLIDGVPYKIRHVVTDAEITGKGYPQQRKLVDFANLRRIPAVKIQSSMITGSRGLWSRYIDPLRCNGSEPDISVLWGSFDGRSAWSKDNAGNENNHSLVIRITFGESSFLITGDLEEIGQRALLARFAANRRILNTDVYIAGHHGSRNGTTEDLMRAMSPELAVISAGNPAAREPGFAAYGYAHPNAKAIELLSSPSFGVSLRRPQVRVAVGVRGRNPKTHAEPTFKDQDIDSAIFSTGWDGDVVVIAGFDGSKRVIID